LLLLGEDYTLLDLKGRYAVFQWLDYLIDQANFITTLKMGGVDVVLKNRMQEETNTILLEKADKIMASFEKEAEP